MRKQEGIQQGERKDVRFFEWRVAEKEREERRWKGKERGSGENWNK